MRVRFAGMSQAVQASSVSGLSGSTQPRNTSAALSPAAKKNLLRVVARLLTQRNFSLAKLG